MNYFFKSNRSGFTLIELLVVISIIGLLASIVLVSLKDVRMKARDSMRIQNITQLKTALNLYAGDHSGSFVVGGSSAYYTSWIEAATPINWRNLETALSPYIKSVPADPLGSGCHGGTPPYGPGGNCGPDLYWTMYISSFVSGAISNGLDDTGCAAGTTPCASGTCWGKALIFMNSTETSVARKECQFNDTANNPLRSSYPNAIMVLVN